MDIKEIWELLDQYRAKPDFRFGSRETLEIIAPYIPDLSTAKKLFDKNLLVSDHTDIPSVSPFIKQFLKSLIKDSDIKTILDPWVNLGEMLYLANEVFPNSSKNGYVLNHNIYEFNELIGKDFEQKLGDSYELLIEENSKFDLIISNLPVGLRTRTKTNSGLAKIDFGLEIALAALNVLNNNGILICTVNSSFFYSTNAEKFKNLINEKGFSINAIFGSPVRSINQHASIPFHFLVIRKGKQKDVFIAEIDDDLEKQQRTLDNFKNHKKSKNIEEGTWLPLRDISPIPVIKGKYELDILLKRTGLPLQSLRELGSFKSLDQVEGDWLIISRSPRKEIIIGGTKDEIKENFNFFFEIDTEKVLTKFLVNLLNSNLGNKLLKTVASRSVHYVVNNKKSLEEIQLPLPSISVQQDILDLNRKIKDIEHEFSELRLGLWKTPKKVKDVEKVLNQKLKNPDNIEWMEELPFRLASILWGYHSESKISKKIEYLLLFFEGLCEFLDILILSALVSNKAFFDSEAKHWLKNDEMQDWYKKASFGGWQFLFEKLAKNVRININKQKPEEVEFIKNLFGNPSDSYFDMITSKSLVNILKDINQLRNSYKGHSGVSSKSQNEKVLGELESAFFDIRDLLVEGFSSVNLLNPVPSTMDWDDELKVFTTTCRILKGTRSKFNQDEIESNKQLSSKKLYLLNENEFTPIEILPLVQMRETPKTEHNACFFYNRIEGDQVRLVSYHFEKEAEIFDSIEDISSVFGVLNPFS